MQQEQMWSCSGASIQIHYHQLPSTNNLLQQALTIQSDWHKPIHIAGSLRRCVNYPGFICYCHSGGKILMLSNLECSTVSMLQEVENQQVIYLKFQLTHNFLPVYNLCMTMHGHNGSFVTGPELKLCDPFLNHGRPCCNDCLYQTLVQG